MSFLTRDWEVMAVDVTTTPAFKAGTPRVLFKLPGPFPLVGDSQQWRNVSRDGQRFVFAINVPVNVTARWSLQGRAPRHLLFARFNKPILERLSQVLGRHGFGVRQVGDGPRDANDAVKGAR